jgi:hypothetical protein
MCIQQKKTRLKVKISNAASKEPKACQRTASPSIQVPQLLSVVVPMLQSLAMYPYLEAENCEIYIDLEWLGFKLNLSLIYSFLF